MRKLLALFLFLFGTVQGFAQTTFPVNGVYDNQDGHYAFTNATIHVSPEQKIEKATLLIKKGKVVAVGTSVVIPKDAVTVDLEGKHIYPSFIELSSDYGMPKVKPFERKGGQTQRESNKPGAYSWNEALRPEIKAAELFEVNGKAAKELRGIGFGTVLTHQHDGMARGTSALVMLGEDSEHEMIVKPNASAHYSFNKGSSTMSYPSSRMGAIALLRQAYYDAKWYASAKEKEYNISLEKWNEIQNLPQFFETGNRLDMLRADKIGDEFGVQYIFRGGGDEYLRIDAVKKTGGAVLLPVSFPKPYDVSDPYDAEELSLAQMKHWELAPTNPAAVAKAGITFAFTTDVLKDKGEFLSALRKAKEYGLTDKQILAALTTTPAKLIKASDKVGTLEAGKIANFLIVSDNIMDEKATIHHNWVWGKPYILKQWSSVDITGKYDLHLDDQTYRIDVKGTADSPELYIMPDEEEADTSKKAKGKKIKADWDNGRIAFTLSAKNDTNKIKMAYRLSGKAKRSTWEGQATKPDGSWLAWSAKRIGDLDEEEKEEEKPSKDDTEKVVGDVWFPFSGYGFTKEEMPKQETVLIKGATVWTGEKDGNLPETDVLIQNGKIAKVGKGLSAKDAKVIDGKGKHLTAGIIDEHSHICINYGVNEGTQASSAEVRIGDVVNSEDVNMYRQLAGGVIGAQLLHGSANPIGGQSALIKFRWGQLPEAMKIKGADGFIKFALGENVKQSNWGSNNTTRFPQTRMGVEQVYEDFFTRAKEYETAMKNGEVVRRDLELDALVEIINKKRFISCHSYVQSEITMLMRIAEKHGFTLNTFTHILEGYKVADKMKEHGAGASTFSDWWAYKYEVMDAIPYNAKIMDAMGIPVAINSDDAEMGRRLNQEAAKGVKYGGMSEEAAWKMVTINPAKLLHIDNRTGSIKEGKDADVVLWSDNPLSVYAKAEKTFVDGICLFDLDTDKKKREQIRAERSRLIQKMLQAKANREKTQPVLVMPKHHYHCGDLDCNNFVDFNVDVNQKVD